MYPPHDLGGGYELLWRQSVEHSRARGWRVRVLTTDYGSTSDPDPDVVRALRWYWRDHAFPRIGWRERRALERHNAAVMDEQLESFAPDAVCWWAMGGMSLSLIERVRRAGVRSAGVVADAWMVYGPRLTPRAGTVDLRDTEWLFCSEYIRQVSGPDLPRWRIAHPGFDAAAFTAAPAREWDWSLAYVGRLDERKGVHLAIDALRHLPDDASLTVCGGGDDEYVSSLRARADGLDVRFIGAKPRDELRDVYAASDAVLFPVQWNEPWGLVPLEAMSVGRPVVASGTGGSAEYLRDGENCILYSPIDSAQALAEGVRRAQTADLDFDVSAFGGDDWERTIEDALCGS
jgi:glycosyltransferase involved in cell wall biosynthesis